MLSSVVWLPYTQPALANKSCFALHEGSFISIFYYYSFSIVLTILRHLPTRFIEICLLSGEYVVVCFFSELCLERPWCPIQITVALSCYDLISHGKPNR